MLLYQVDFDHATSGASSSYTLDKAGVRTMVLDAFPGRELVHQEKEYVVYCVGPNTFITVSVLTR